MAKEIKAIKCPSCGSTAKTEIKPDVYRCNNCQTEYFLDDDDITVNYNHNYNHTYGQGQGNDPQLNAITLKKIFTVIAVVAFIMFVVILFSNLFRKGRPSVNYSVLATGAKEKEFDATVYFAYPMAPAGQNPIVMAMEDRNYNSEKDKKKDGFYVAFYDAVSKKRFSDQKVGEDNIRGSGIKPRILSDGQTYLQIENSVFRVDPKAGKLTDAGNEWFAAVPALQVGLATVTFVYEEYGDGLLLLTNDGKKLYYYPLVKKLYTEDQFYKARNGAATLLPGAKERTYFTFTASSTEYPNEILQLLKIRYMDNMGGPQDRIDRPSWGKDFGGSGIFTDRDPFVKVLIRKDPNGRLVDWKDFSPGRLYFSPEILLDRGNELLIQFKPDANPKSHLKVQQINTKNGAVMWTTALPDDTSISQVTKYKDGFIAAIGLDSIVFMDTKGQIKPGFKISTN